MSQRYYATLFRSRGADRYPWRICRNMAEARRLAMLYSCEADYLSAGRARRSSRRRDPNRPPLVIPPDAEAVDEIALAPRRATR